jgi:predicted transcriptional regulator of viral defense system
VISILEKNVFVTRLGEVSEKEKEVLIRISLIEEPLISPSMIKIRGITEFLSRLERKGFLLKKQRGLYELFHPLFKEYLRKLAKTK